MDLFFQHSFIEELVLDGCGNVLLIMRRTYAGGNDGDQVRGIDTQEFFHGPDRVGDDVACRSCLAGVDQGAVAVFLVVQPDGGAVCHVDGEHAVGNSGAQEAVHAFHGIVGADVTHQRHPGSMHLLCAAQVLPPPAESFHLCPVVRFQPFQDGLAVSGYVHSRDSFNKLDDFSGVGLDGFQECGRFHHSGW